MALMTLEQLKAENAKAEAEANRDPQTDEPKVEAEATEEELNTEDPADTGSEEEGEPEAEPWMSTGEDEGSETGDESHAQERKFTDSDVAAARRNMRAKLERKHDKEKSELEQRIADLESKLSVRPAQQMQGKAAKPKLSDFEDEVNPQEAYMEALTDWKIATNNATQHASAQKDEQARAIREYEESVENAVEQHYERAVDLAQKSGIKPEMYQAADLKVREMAEEVFPDAGDAIVDNLIYNLGEGSEKVMYNIGVNAKRRAEVRKLLLEDRTGLRASAYLGRLSGELSSPGKRTSKAPAPAANPAGDSKTSESYRALKRKYTDAHKRGDTQAAFNARREARQAGADVTDW